jgi:outer membrane protein OmpU
MKKILFASTALVATAGMAAADINFSGYGRFGVGFQEDRGTDVDDTIVISRFRLNIDGDATTDGGVRFSARVRMQADENSTTGEAGAAGLNGARFSAEYEGLRVDVGNVAGAIDNLPGYYGYEPGLEFFVGQYAAVDYGFLGYSSGGGGSNAVYTRYAAGDFAVAASYDQRADADGGNRWDIHAAYTFGDWTAALAYGENDADDDIVVLSVGGSFGNFNVNFLVGDETIAADAAASDTFYGVSGSYDISSATSVNFAYGDGSGDADNKQYGIGFVHDLGGGVSLKGGFGETDNGTDKTSRADFGVNFNF